MSAKALDKKWKELLFWAGLLAVTAAVAIAAVWLLVPRSLAGLIDTSAPVELRIQQPDQEDVNMTIAPGTPEMEALEAVLKAHTYHPHWTTLLGNTGAQSYVSDTYRILYDLVVIQGAEGQTYQFGGELTWFKKCVPDDPYSKKSRVLLLDHFGKTEGAVLRRELMEALDIR